MKPGRVVALVIGILLLLPAFGLLAGGGALAWAYSTQRDDDGFFDVTLDPLATPTPAITAEDIDLASGPGSPDFVLDWLDADVRLRATSDRPGQEIFIGIAPEDDLEQYLAGVGRDEIVDVDGSDPRYDRRGGAIEALTPPTEEAFWEASAVGAGTQEIIWEPTSGRWGVALLNADGSPGVAAEVNVGAKSGFVVPLIWILVGVGFGLLVLAAVLIVLAVVGHRAEPTPAAAPAEPVPAAVPAAGGELVPPSPVTLEASLDPGLSRWQWLVKWFLAIPHFIVLAFLWLAFAVLTVVAFFAILLTGRYPRGLFDFNLGVLRWSWRVVYYAAHGGLGTDRYPPFSLGAEPDYPATLDIAYPERLSRGLVLVKWWLLAIPHYLVVGLLLGGTWYAANGDEVGFTGLIPLLVFFAAVILLFTGRYPQQLFNLVIGLNRWVYRVVAYAALMTDRYPPFRLDQGGSEPRPEPAPPGPSGAPSEATAPAQPGEAELVTS